GRSGGGAGGASAGLSRAAGVRLGVAAGASVGEEQIRAGVREPSRDRPADAAGRAGDQSDTALQIPGHGLTRIRIGLPSLCSSFSMPTRTSSSATMSLI